MPDSVRWLTETDIKNIEENGVSLGFMFICSLVSFILYNKGDRK